MLIKTYQHNHITMTMHNTFGGIKTSQRIQQRLQLLTHNSIVAHTFVYPYHCIDFTLADWTCANQLKMTLTDIHNDVSNQSSVSFDPEFHALSSKSCTANNHRLVPHHQDNNLRTNGTLLLCRNNNLHNGLRSNQRTTHRLLLRTNRIPRTRCVLYRSQNDSFTSYFANGDWIFRRWSLTLTRAARMHNDNAKPIIPASQLVHTLSPWWNNT